MPTFAGVVATACLTVFSAGSPEAGIPDKAFTQEYSETYAIDPGGPGDDVRAIALDPKGGIWAATKAGVRLLRDGAWKSVEGVADGPAYSLWVDAKSDTVYVGAWDGVYIVSDGKASKVESVDGPVTVVRPAQGGIVALGPDKAYAYSNSKQAWRPLRVQWSRNLRDALLDASGTLWIATGMGLYAVQPPEGEKELALGLEGATKNRVRHYFRQPEDLYTGALNALESGLDGRLWIGGWGGIDVYGENARSERLTYENGLPNFDVRALAFAPDGTLWAGTAMGVVRYNPGFKSIPEYNGSAWSLRHSLRWLPSDDVRDIVLGPDGTAWIATAAGVGAIKKRSMTLAAKAEHFEKVLEQRHIRPPYLVEKCFFPNPKDLTHWEPVDDDNDGQYTNIYMGMECFRYAATKDPKAKANADNAFDAMEFLQTVTGTPGFIARTVVPKDWPKVHDGNETIPPEVAADRRARDPRYKQVEVRWRPSADGKWLWKGDTSSDEITGHFYGYLVYYDLAADDARKERVKKLVRRVMDGIIDGGYVLRDLDGEPTRWGVWSPEKLLHDADWRVEAPINAFEILSYLKTAHHITGDAKYDKEYKRLLHEHGYLDLVRRPKAYGLSERTHIDDELIALAAPALMLYEDDPDLLAVYREGYTWTYNTVRNDQDPFMDFTYAWLLGREVPVVSDVAFLRISHWI